MSPCPGPPFFPPLPGPIAPRTESTSAVTRAVRPDLSVVACATVNFPAVTAASISFVFAATRAVIKAAFFAPAIVPSVSPAARRVLIVAASMPIVVATSA